MTAGGNAVTELKRSRVAAERLSAHRGLRPRIGTRMLDRRTAHGIEMATATTTKPQIPAADLDDGTFVYQ